MPMHARAKTGDVAPLLAPRTLAGRAGGVTMSGGFSALLACAPPTERAHVLDRVLASLSLIGIVRIPMPLHVADRRALAASRARRHSCFRRRRRHPPLPPSSVLHRRRR
ncbi:transcriptional regulator, LacI family domain protein [Burkholderia thailandensis]|nr:transcriptional regulator, LacI family domain protein [Burkholderia thailandensis]